MLISSVANSLNNKQPVVVNNNYQNQPSNNQVNQQQSNGTVNLINQIESNNEILESKIVPVNKNIQTQKPKENNFPWFQVSIGIILVVIFGLIIALFI